MKHDTDSTPFTSGKCRCTRQSSLLEYDDDYIKKLRRFNKYQVLYAIYWFGVNDAPNAQALDLWFLKTLHEYRDTVDEEVGSACLATALNHVQFLAPEFCFLSLVSNSKDKAEIAAAILSSTPPPKDENGKSQFEIQAPEPTLKITEDNSDSISVKQLVGGPRVYLPFHLLKIGTSFLEKEPEQWAAEEDFLKLSQFVANLRVVNDTAERAVQLFSDYHGKVTKGEEQKQCLMSTVREQRREKADLTRKTLTEKYQQQSK